MNELTGKKGLREIELSGGAANATYTLKKGHRYQDAPGERIRETYRQLEKEPMTGLALLNDLKSRNWLLPHAQRPYSPSEFWKHLRDIVSDKRLHVLKHDSNIQSSQLGRTNDRSAIQGIAFKAIFNDGGASSEGLIGYRGVCSDRVMVQNVEVDRKKKKWCCNPNNECRQYCDRGRRGRKPKNPCYESSLLEKPITFYTGTYHTGGKGDQLIPIDFDKVPQGNIALLTTVPPGRAESERIIFACFRVGNADTDEIGNFIRSDGSMDIVLPDDIATDCRYWDYQKPNHNGTYHWGSGLFRYLDDNAIQRFLDDLAYRLGDAAERDVLIRVLGKSVKAKPHMGGPRSFGGRSGGEGEAHLKLKELVAKHPSLIGLPAKSEPHVEYSFLSGDRVDVMFDLPNGNAAVVEVETIVPLPGAHQAVKYRALLEVERDEPLGSGNVEAILVAHQFDTETRALAKKYQVRLIELRA